MSSYMRRIQAESRQNKQNRIAQEHLMQIECTTCKCRVFYLMAQEDGSIEAYCAMHNHKRILVNIPELVEHVLKGQHEDKGTDGASASDRTEHGYGTYEDTDNRATRSDNLDEQNRLNRMQHTEQSIPGDVKL